jgi:hypothetical protein
MNLSRDAFISNDNKSETADFKMEKEFATLILGLFENSYILFQPLPPLSI